MTMNSKLVNELGAFVLGFGLIFVSVSMLWGLPAKTDMFWIHSSEMTNVQEIESKGLIQGLRFESDIECCIFVKPNDEGFIELLSAYHRKLEYRLGYTKEKALFSSNPKLYVMIYEIQVNGNQVKSYESFIVSTKKTFGAMGIFGIVFLLWSYFEIYPYRKNAN